MSDEENANDPTKTMNLPINEHLYKIEVNDKIIKCQSITCFC